MAVPVVTMDAEVVGSQIKVEFSLPPILSPTENLMHPHHMESGPQGPTTASEPLESVGVSS